MPKPIGMATMVAEVASGQVRHESLGIKFMAMRINGWWRAGMPGAGVVCAVALSIDFLCS